MPQGKSFYMQADMVGAFDALCTGALSGLRRSSSWSREEIFTGALMSALMDRDAAVVLAALFTGDPKVNCSNAQVHDVYAPSEPIDLLIMVHREGCEGGDTCRDDRVPRDCKYSVCVEIKRFGTNSNFKSFYTNQGKIASWTSHLTPQGYKKAKRDHGLWQIDAATYTKRNEWWRAHCDKEKYPVKHYVLLTPMPPGQPVNIDRAFSHSSNASRSNHRRWIGTSYLQFAEHITQVITKHPNKQKYDSLLPVLKLLFPL